MRRVVPEATVSMTPQQIYDAVKQSIENVEADVYSLDEIFAMLSQGKKFVEDNFDVE